MWSKVKKYITEYPMIEKGDHILVGVSGGADSVCLLRFLLEIKKEQNFKIYAVHINHMIREEGAVRDETFSKRLCQEWDVPLKIYRIDVQAYARNNKMTEEEAGRTVRYTCFEEMARQWNCNKIAVAHHKDDLAETVLFRMIRGSGVFGLGAIAPVAGNRIRPLLGITKKEILEILKQLGQSFVLDETNEEIEYSRNYIRHEILPRMSQVNSRASEHISQLAMQALELQECLEPIFESAYQSTVKVSQDSLLLSIKEYQTQKKLVQGEIIRRVLFELAKKRKDISQIHIEQIKNLIFQEAGKRLSLPYQVEVIRERNDLRFYRVGEWKMPALVEDRVSYEIPQLKMGESFSITLEDGVIVTFTLEAPNQTDYTNGDCVKCLDYGKINGSICIRNRRDGDYFIVDKVGHKKMLRRYFIDAKIPKEERGRQLLLADDSHILWILGGRISESYKVTEDTEYVLKVTWSRNTLEKMEE